MKLLRFEVDGQARVGAKRDDDLIDLVAAGSRWHTMTTIIRAGGEALAELAGIIAAAPAAGRVADARLLAPIERPGKYLAIGMNYSKHKEESVRVGFTAASRQMWFNKQTSCLAGPYDDIRLGVSEEVDYEVELGAVIGVAAKGVSAADASRHVFGYLVANDVSARDWQRHSPTFTMGKSFDTHGPVGPWIVTADEIPDPHALDLRCYVNGEERQNSNTRYMSASLWDQITYLSTAFTLDPGDLIATGTPEGIGLAMEPPVFLKDGDVVRCEVEGIGAIENCVVAGG